MTPEAARFLDKARRLLVQAELMIGIGLHEAAGRTAYLAAFHAAQALIFERRGISAKTHKGVHTEFLRLTRHDAGFDPALKGFLSWAYNLKSAADYETTPASDVTPERAAQAAARAERFVAQVGALLSDVPPQA